MLISSRDRGKNGAETTGKTPDVAPELDVWRLRTALLVAGCLVSMICRLQAAGSRYEIREIKPHVFVWIPEDIHDQDGDPQYSRAGTASFLIGPDGVVVVNTTNSPFHARELLFEIGRRTEQPVKVVINTDSQADHFLGNEVFVDQRAPIIASTAVQAGMRQYVQELGRRTAGNPRLQARVRGFHFTLPNKTPDSETPLNIAGEQVKFVGLDAAGLSGHLAVLLPRSKVLFLGDLFENQYFPRVGSIEVRKWIEFLRQAETWDVDVFVPGHGPPGSKKDVGVFRQFFEQLESEVEARVREGKSLPQVKAELSSFASYPWHAPELAEGAVEAVYAQEIRSHQGSAGAQHAVSQTPSSRDP